MAAFMNEPPDKNDLPTLQEAASILALTFLALLGTAMLLGVFTTEQLSRPFIILIELVIVLPALYYARKNDLDIAAVFRLRLINKEVVLASVVIGVSLTVIGEEIGRLMELILPIPEEYREIYIAQFQANSPADWFFLIIGVVFVASITEEMTFRGFFQRSAEKQLDVTRGVLLTAFVFSLLHMSEYAFVQIVLLGVLLGVMAWRTDSVLPAMIAHSINNGISLLVINTDESRLQFIEWHGHINPVLVLLCIGGLVFGFSLLYRASEQEDGAESANQTIIE